MPNFAEEIVDFLVTQSIGTKGTTIFVDEWPAAETSTATTVVVIERGGGEGFRHSPAVDTSFDIWIRAANYPTAYQKAADVFNAINSDTLIQLTNHRVMRAICRTPGSVGKDNQKRQLLKLGADMTIAPNSDPGGGGAGKGGGRILPSG